jgi:hypothetical protein
MMDNLNELLYELFCENRLNREEYKTLTAYIAEHEIRSLLREDLITFHQEEI